MDEALRNKCLYNLGSLMMIARSSAETGEDLADVILYKIPEDRQRAAMLIAMMTLIALEAPDLADQAAETYLATAEFMSGPRIEGHA